LIGQEDAPLQVKDARRQPASFLISLRDRGLLRLDDGRIMMSGLRWCPAYAIAARSSLFGLLESASAVA
jgi:hypothetical protein